MSSWQLLIPVFFIALIAGYVVGLKTTKPWRRRTYVLLSLLTFVPLLFLPVVYGGEKFGYSETWLCYTLLGSVVLHDPGGGWTHLMLACMGICLLHVIATIGIGYIGAIVLDRRTRRTSQPTETAADQPGG